MIPFLDIRSAIVRGLAEALGMKVIEMNVAAPMPPYPFVTYEFSTPTDDPVGLPTIIQADNKTFHVETVLFTVSFQSYAQSKKESIQNAMRAREWFQTAGHLHIKDAVGVVVVDVGAIDNRDVKVGDEWERKNGFDVDFRTANTVEIHPERIETITLGE